MLFSKVFLQVCPFVAVTASRRVMFHLTETKRNKRLRKQQIFIIQGPSFPPWKA